MEKKSAKKNRGWIGIVVILAVVAATVAMAIAIPSGAFKPAVAEAPGGSAQADPTPAPIYRSYDAGSYKVGVHIYPGEYYVYCPGEGVAEVTISTDAALTVDSVIASHSSSKGFYVTVNDGEYLTLTNGTMHINSDETPVYAILMSTGYEVDLPEGQYKVDKWFPAGEYLIEPDEFIGHYEIYKDSLYRLDSLIASDYVDSHDGSVLLTLREGQYLDLTRCHIHIPGKGTEGE